MSRPDPSRVTGPRPAGPRPSRAPLRAAALLAGALAAAGAGAGAGASEPRIGGLAVSPVAPSSAPGPRPSHAGVPALDATGCRVPLLVARCRTGGMELVWAFDMPIAPGAESALAFDLQLGGRSVGRPDDGADAAAPWPLSANRRTATLPPAAARAVLAALPAGGEAVFRLDDPASGSVLRDRFDLPAFAAALAGLDCPGP